MNECAAVGAKRRQWRDVLQEGGSRADAGTRALAFATLLRAVDEIQGDDVRKKGVEFLDVLIAGGRRDKLTVIPGGRS